MPDPSAPTPIYKRVLLKLSGEALMGDQQFGVDPVVATRIARDVGELQSLGAPRPTDARARILHGSRTCNIDFFEVENFIWTARGSEASDGDGGREPPHRSAPLPSIHGCMSHGHSGSR